MEDAGQPSTAEDGECVSRLEHLLRVTQEENHIHPQSQDERRVDLVHTNDCEATPARRVGNTVPSPTAERGTGSKIQSCFPAATARAANAKIKNIAMQSREKSDRASGFRLVSGCDCGSVSSDPLRESIVASAEVSVG
eukprot:6207554-Pleurochrysis_carterae.AAC.2